MRRTVKVTDRQQTFFDDASEALAAGMRFIYAIPDNAERHEAGYIPSAIFENTAGHYPMLGNGPHATPWYWGTNIDEARKVAASANARRGITPDEALRILSSSIMASLVMRRGR